MIRQKASLGRFFTSIIAVQRDGSDDGDVLFLLMFVGWVG